MLRAEPEAAVIHGDVRRWLGRVPLDVVKPPAVARAHRALVMPVHHPACLVRVELFTRFGGFDTSYRIFADYDWFGRVGRGGIALRYCPQVLTNFQVGGVSTMQLAAQERYRVLRANGAGLIAAIVTVGYSCGVVLRNRWRRVES
jgi:hypothetical protein